MHICLCKDPAFGLIVINKCGISSNQYSEHYKTRLGLFHPKTWWGVGGVGERERDGEDVREKETTEFRFLVLGGGGGVKISSGSPPPLIQIEQSLFILMNDMTCVCVVLDYSNSYLIT